VPKTKTPPKTPKTPSPAKDEDLKKVEVTPEKVEPVEALPVVEPVADSKTEKEPIAEKVEEKVEEEVEKKIDPKVKDVKVVTPKRVTPAKKPAAPKPSPAKPTKTAKETEITASKSVSEKVIEALTVTEVTPIKIEVVDETVKENKSDAKNKLELPKVPPIKLTTAPVENLIKVTLTPVVTETPETLKQKESHLLSLGLLTLKAAKQAKLDKQRRKEALTKKGAVISGPGGKHGKGQKSGGNEYTGTLKIKLKRPKEDNKRNSREPLKMTIQKGKVKTSTDKHANGEGKSVENTFYTIQNEVSGPENKKEVEREFLIDS
jgi:hypothetical protein